MPTPTVSIQVPMLERNAPVQKAAKTRWRNGANGRVMESARYPAGSRAGIGI